MRFIKIITQITNNHLNAAKEHINKYAIEHTPTLLQALRMTIYDYCFNKVMFDERTGSHLVYEVIKVPTLGIRSANVIRMYVPKEFRGQGVVSSLLDKIPEKVVISSKGRYGEVGRLYVSRTVL